MTPPSFDSPISLAAYGWDRRLTDAFSPYRESGLLPGRIAGVDRGLCTVITDDGALRAAVPPALTADPLSAPCTGDWCAVRAGDPPMLAELLPRHTAIVRSTASRRAEGQVLAANVDTVVIVVSLASWLELARVERLLALAWESGARPVIALTQADLHADPDAAAVEVSTTAPGVDVVAVSAITGAGMDAFRAVIDGTIALIGPSGTGKSTLGNVLLGAERLATGAVRARDGKGRHTTVRRELLPLPGGGVLIDTPGLRGVGLWDASEGLAQVFADIEELAEECGFRDCTHNSEPGCAVLAAVEDGSLPRRRLDSYRKLLRENEWIASRTDARLRAERKNRRKTIKRSLRDSYRLRGRDR